MRAGPHGAAVDVTILCCDAARGGPGDARHADRCHVVLVRRGVFAAHVGRRTHVADPCTALVSPAGIDYRISHPGTQGDDCTVLELAPDVADELRRSERGDAIVELPLTGSVQAAAAIFAAYHAAARDRAGVEDAALELAQVVVQPAATRSAPAAERRRVTRSAIAMLHATLADNVPVSELAQRLGCSPFHLMRLFRAETGTTLRGYRLQLRLAAALHQLARGRDDLAGVAVEVGFASHAHLADAFRAQLGATPSQLRTALRQPGVGALQRFLARA